MKTTWQVILSVENECKFCKWKATEGNHPKLVYSNDGLITAFCPMCNFELPISSQEPVKKDLTNVK